MTLLKSQFHQFLRNNLTLEHQETMPWRWDFVKTVPVYVYEVRNDKNISNISQMVKLQLVHEILFVGVPYGVIVFSYGELQ